MIKNKTNVLNMPVLVWKDSNGLYFPTGKYVFINCNHQKEGNYGVNISGESFPVPTNTVPPGTISSPPGAYTNFEQQTALVDAGNVFGSVTPFVSDDPKYKKCVRVKDFTTMITYYVDATDYANKIPLCNPVAYTAT